MTETGQRLDCGWGKEINWKLQKSSSWGTKHEACLTVRGEVSPACDAIKLARCKYTGQAHVTLAGLGNLCLSSTTNVYGVLVFKWVFGPLYTSPKWENVTGAWIQVKRVHGCLQGLTVSPQFWRFFPKETKGLTAGAGCSLGTRQPTAYRAASIFWALCRVCADPTPSSVLISKLKWGEGGLTLLHVSFSLN